MSARKNTAGSAWKPRSAASGEYGRYAPIATTTSTATTIVVLGRLRQNGTRRVRMTNTTRVWVASDSTNQPERNRLGPASNT